MKGDHSMMTHGCSTDSATADALPRGTATTADASTLVTRLWPAILAVAAVGGNLALTCVVPFAAFAVATAGTLRRRSAVGTMSGMGAAVPMITRVLDLSIWADPNGWEG
jgi:hypothetical protein